MSDGIAIALMLCGSFVGAFALGVKLTLDKRDLCEKRGPHEWVASGWRCQWCGKKQRELKT